MTNLSSSERGDKKKAANRLRVVNGLRSHHFSAFRGGFMLGLAVPAFISGMYQGMTPLCDDLFLEAVAMM